MAELRECPFCGSAAQWWPSPLVEEDPDDKGGRYECSDPCCNVHSSADFPTEQAARSHWNRRPAPSGVDVEAVVRAACAVLPNRDYSLVTEKVAGAIRTALSAAPKAGGV